MTDKLTEMLRAQLELQRQSFDVDPTTLEGEERAEFIRWNVLALEDELHEALNEVGWKPWASDRSIDRDLFLKEMVDAWHFFMNLLLVGSSTEPDLLAEIFTSMYQEKRQVNADRQAAGYTGTDKCPQCGRDRATTQIVIYAEPRPYCPCGYVYQA